jgi:REP element-mobilizing transposase RayT
VRGIERRRIFRSDQDRRWCLDRFGELIIKSGAGLYAWCLMPNHVHALLRTGNLPLGNLMRRWVGPYASHFNRRYARAGHLFQNRFKSILVEEERYLLELVRYIHLNPVRARLGVSIDDLDVYRWTGHAVLLGQRAFPAHDADFVLAHFGDTVGAARQAYREFVRAAGVPGDLSGGGLRRSAGGWEHLPRLRRGREHWAHDERVLGSSEFVQAVLEISSRPSPPPADPSPLVAVLCERAAARFEVTAAQIASRSVRRPVLAARALVCHLAVTRFRLSLTAVGRCLGVSKQSVIRALDRAPALAASIIDWDDLCP